MPGYRPLIPKPGHWGCRYSPDSSFREPILVSDICDSGRPHVDMSSIIFPAALIFNVYLFRNINIDNVR